MFNISQLFESWHDPKNKESFKTDARKIKQEHKEAMSSMDDAPDFLKDAQKRITKRVRSICVLPSTTTATGFLKLVLLLVGLYD